NRRPAIAAISSIAELNDSSLLFDGLLNPVILRTNCNDAARTSSSVTGGSKLKSVLMFLHITEPLSFSMLRERERFPCRGLRFLLCRLGLESLGIFVTGFEILLQLGRILQKRFRHLDVLLHDGAVAFEQLGFIFLQKAFAFIVRQPNGQGPRLMQQ